MFGLLGAEIPVKLRNRNFYAGMRTILACLLVADTDFTVTDVGFDDADGIGFCVLPVCPISHIPVSHPPESEYFEASPSFEAVQHPVLAFCKAATFFPRSAETRRYCSGVLVGYSMAIVSHCNCR